MTIYKVFIVKGFSSICIKIAGTYFICIFIRFSCISKTSAFPRSYQAKTAMEINILGAAVTQNILAMCLLLVLDVICVTMPIALYFKRSVILHTTSRNSTLTKKLNQITVHSPYFNS